MGRVSGYQHLARRATERPDPGAKWRDDCDTAAARSSRPPAAAALATLAGGGWPGTEFTPAVVPQLAVSHQNACAAFGGAYQLPGADGITPAAWSGGGLVVPACGPLPGAGNGAPVYPYPGSLWTPGYQCVEFAERYLYARFGIRMSILTNGDQVAAHYATNFAALFMLVKNGTPRRAPADGDVLSMSTSPGFDSASGGHTAVVQASAVDAAGDGTITIVEENGVSSGVQVIGVTHWQVRYAGFPYIEWLAVTGPRGYSPM
jgi:CHAP domain